MKQSRGYVVLGFFLSSLLSEMSSAAQFLPDNDLDQLDTLGLVFNMDEAAFDQTIDEVTAYYSKIVEYFDAKLVVRKSWNDSTVNAGASQSGSSWRISFYGGLARRPELTTEGFALAVCHEVGHHLGGFPMSGFFNSWAAIDGQADYFATQECLRNIWAKDTDRNAEAQKTVDSTAQESCDAVYSEQPRRNLCYRIANASLETANLMAALKSKPVKPTFGTPDPSVAQSTYQGHPAPQCRLDTWFQGGLCPVAYEAHLIPGKDESDSIKAEEIAAKNSCTTQGGYTKGVRPLCWFKPKL